ncbi:hypothetical protein, variant [Spizellomyces punctatus DAOM BR117]|uniref:ATPase inhibitor, mitochondrial n=1 Tax=Spizellomyces punctatus (strain DAOM BR117) TaxID=645134 RepID=A0A0L0HMZ3_SPIPD|nr:hypothetical protein, variant [Spizellomyces punctatus DAOM BR117]KND02467.1 hypothetical protein, variant [Spizellomyces punctatus DAOM BR117]|eukprot:XP_016610506.1 hypothetical protein, variant [Spizellomyces punctatus DAOM BR117]
MASFRLLSPSVALRPICCCSLPMPMHSTTRSIADICHPGGKHDLGASHIREARGGFALREFALEEKYFWDHEKEIIRELQAKLQRKETEVLKRLDADPKMDPEFREEILKDGRSVSGVHGADAFKNRPLPRSNTSVTGNGNV